MSFNKIYHYKAIITIHEIHITVKFPCYVSLGLKNHESGSESAPSVREFKLEQGYAKANYEMTTEISLKHNSKFGLFSQSKVRLIIYLKSSSGKIPAGSSTIVIKSDKDQNRALTEIEKCPDRNAKIEYSLKMKFINQQQCLDESLVSRYTPHEHILNTEIPLLKTIRQRAQTSQNPRKKTLRTQLYTSRVSSQTPNRNLFTENKSQKQETVSNSKISRIIMREHEMQANSQRQKIIDLEHEKSKAMKQIRTLKYQLETTSLKMSNISEREDRFLSEKRQTRIMILEDEIQKQKVKNMQSRGQLHRARLRIQELDNQLKMHQKIRQELEEQITKQKQQKQGMDRKYKMLTNELRDIKQKYENVLLLQENTNKRHQFKQNVFKQQIKALNEKYTSAEAERHKILFEKNQIVNEISMKEASSQEIMRDCQKLLAQERGKLLKNIQVLQRSLALMKEEKDSEQRLVAQLQIQNHKIRLENQENKNLVSQLQIQIKQYETELKNHKNIIDQLQKLLKLRSNSSHVTNKLKATIQQKQQQIKQNQKVIHQLEFNNKITADKIDQYARLNLEKQNTINQLQKQYETVSKKLVSFGQEDRNDFMPLNDEKNGHYYASQGKTKFQAGTVIKPTMKPKVISRDEPIKQLEKKLQNSNRKIQQLCEQNHDLCENNFIIANNLMNLQETYNQLSKKYEQIKSKREETTTQEKQIDSLKAYNEELSKQIDSILALKTQIEQTYALELKEKIMKISELEDQIVILQEKTDKLFIVDELEESHHTINQKQQELRLANMELVHAQNHIKIMQESAEQQTKEKIKLNAEIEKLKAKLHEKSQRNMKSDRNLAVQDTNNKQYEVLLKASNEQIVKYEQQIDKKEEELTEMDNKLVSLQGELDRYWQQFNQNKLKFEEKNMELLQYSSKIKEQEKEINDLIKENELFRQAIQENEIKNGRMHLQIQLEHFKKQINRVLPSKYRLPETSSIHPNALILQIEEMVVEKEEREQHLINRTNPSEQQTQNSVFRDQQNNIVRLNMQEKQKEIERLSNQIMESRRKIENLIDTSKELEWMNKKIGQEHSNAENQIKVLKLQNQDLILKLTNSQTKNANLKKQGKQELSKKKTEEIAHQLFQVIQQLPTQRKDREKMINSLGQYKQVLRKLLGQFQKQDTNDKEMHRKIKELNKGLQKFKLNVVATINRMPEAKNHPQLKNLMNELRDLQIAVDSLSPKN